MDRQRRRRRDQAAPLDLNLAERVLSGALPPEDLPPALGPMARAIEALRTDAPPPRSMRAEGDQRTIDSMVSFLSASARHPARRLRHPAPSVLPRRVVGFKVRIATAVMAAALAFLLGVAYAGRLPGPAQNAISGVLSKVGLSVPRHDRTDEGNHGSDDQGGADAKVPVGPDPNGPAHDGLCNAYFHGQGGTQGGKFDSVAFQNLEDAAAEAGQTVEEFCGVDAPPAVTVDEHGKGKDGQGHQGDETDDMQGSDEQGSSHENNGHHGDNGNHGDNGKSADSSGHGNEKDSGD
jgi:hypothetical protein